MANLFHRPRHLRDALFGLNLERNFSYRNLNGNDSVIDRTCTNIISSLSTYLTTNYFIIIAHILHSITDGGSHQDLSFNKIINNFDRQYGK